MSDLATMALVRPVVFIDIESAGEPDNVDASQDRIVQFGAMRFEESFDEIPELFTFECNPGIPIVKERSDVHGYTDEKVKHLPLFSQFAVITHEFVMGCDIGGFNVIGYDLPLLWTELSRCNILWDVSKTRCLDAGNIFKKKHPRNLAAAVRTYLGREHTEAHSAIGDIAETFQVLMAQIKQHRNDAEEPLDSFESVVALSKMDDRIDLFGTIRMKDGIPVFGTRRNRNVPVVHDIGYAEWILRSDFPAQTKDVIRRILEEENERRIQESIDNANDESEDSDVPWR